MADLRPQYNEGAVGANHPTLADVINRAWNVEHEEDGTHGTIKGNLFMEGNIGVGVAPTWPGLYIEKTVADIIFRLYNEHAATPYGQFIWFTAADPNDQTQYFIQGSDKTATEFTIWSDGSFAQASDVRTKVDIVSTGSWLDKVVNLPIREYQKIHDKSKRMHVGIIASEVTEDFGHLVNVINKKTDNLYEKKRLEDQYMLNYIGFVPIALKAIQEQQLEIEELIQRIKLLEIT